MSEKEVEKQTEAEEPRIGVFICHCGLNIAGVIDIDQLVEYAETLPDVVYVKDNRYTCADPGQEEIKKAIKENNLNRVVVAACSPRMHEPTFRRTVSEAGLNPFLFEMANIREFSSWCHPSTPQQATEKAKELINMAVAKARLLTSLEPMEVPVTDKALVIGGGIAGMNAALNLADAGVKTYLLERGESIGGHMAQLDKTFPTLDCSICMPGDEEVILSDGSIMAIEDLVNEIIDNRKNTFNPHPPLTYSFKNHNVELDEVIAAQKLSSPSKLIEVQTSTGMRLRFTYDHKIMIDTPEGPSWIRCADLKEGERLYAPRELDVREPPDKWIVDLLPGDFKVAETDLINVIRQRLKKKFGSLRKAASNLDLSYRDLQRGRCLSISELKKACKTLALNWENIRKKIWTITYRGSNGDVQLGSQVIDKKIMYMLGLLASDGHIEQHRIRFCNTNSVLVRSFIKNYEETFPTRSVCLSYIESEKTTQKTRTVVQVKNKILLQLANKLEIKGNLKPIFRLNKNLIAAFLRGFFDGDGYATLKKYQNWTTAKVTFSLGDNYDYGYRLHLLLKRLGIVSKVYKYSRGVIIDISERRDVLQFAKKVGSGHPEKAHRFKQIIKECAYPKSRGGLFEELPLKCGKLLSKLTEKYHIPLRVYPLTHTNMIKVLRQERRITRQNMARILNAIEGLIDSDDEDFKELQRIYHSNSFLDKVKALKVIDSTEDHVYDVTMKDTHSFIPKGAFVVSNCIEGPKMVDVGRHPNIEIISYADLQDVSGFVGNFKVKIRKNPRYVIAENCTGCGECRDVCPIEYPNQWDMNLGVREAISVPFDQAVPLVYTLNKDYCIECYKCVDACGAREAINFEQEPEDIELEVGAIIVSTGYDIYLPYDDPLYGYGKYSNVITSLEFERLILAAGPTVGKVVRASDGKKPDTVAFIQCVGSRDVNKYPYCSNFCCMYTLKHAIQLKEKYGEDIEVYVFYIDMRSNFEGFEEFYQRARELGVNFIRGRVSRVLEVPETNNLVIHAEDTGLGQPLELEAGMVVLATAAIPKKGTGELARILHLTRGADGFFMESHPKLKPIDAPSDGIFFAGACQAPKDIPYSVSQGCGAAGRASTVLSKPTWEIEPIIAVVDPDKCRNTERECGICAQKCPYGAIKAEEGKPAQVITAMCHGCGTCVAECPADAIRQMHFTDAQIFAQIRTALKENPEEKILAFLCNWCSYAGADLAGTSRFEYPPVIRPIRVMCSGRVDRDFILEAFRLGAGMVMVGACHLPHDCHYISGNEKMKNRMEALAPMLEKLGLTPERLRVEYISAAEGVKFAEVVTEMTEQMHNLGKDEIKSENDKLRPILEKMLKRKGIC